MARADPALPSAGWPGPGLGPQPLRRQARPPPPPRAPRPFPLWVSEILPRPGLSRSLWLQPPSAPFSTTTMRRTLPSALQSCRIPGGQGECCLHFTEREAEAQAAAPRPSLGLCRAGQGLNAYGQAPPWPLPAARRAFLPSAPSSPARLYPASTRGPGPSPQPHAVSSWVKSIHSRVPWQP